MTKRSMLIEAFRPNTGWSAGLSRIAPEDRWKIHLLRFGAALLVAALLLALGVRNPQLR